MALESGRECWCTKKLSCYELDPYAGLDCFLTTEQREDICFESCDGNPDQDCGKSNVYFSQYHMFRNEPHPSCGKCCLATHHIYLSTLVYSFFDSKYRRAPAVVAGGLFVAHHLLHGSI